MTRRLIKATVVQADGTRSVITLIAPSRRDAEQLLDKANPEARYMACIVVR